MAILNKKEEQEILDEVHLNEENINVEIKLLREEISQLKDLIKENLNNTQNSK